MIQIDFKDIFKDLPCADVQGINWTTCVWKKILIINLIEESLEVIFK